MQAIHNQSKNPIITVNNSFNDKFKFNNMTKTQTEMVEWIKSQPTQRYAKFGTFKFRIATEQESIVTSIDGEVETKNTANVGDYILTGAKGENYVLSPSKFTSRYKQTSENEAEATGEFFGCVHLGKPFEFIASWKETMICNDGDMLGSPDETLSEVYRIEAGAFKETYRKQD